MAHFPTHGAHFVIQTYHSRGYAEDIALISDSVKGICLIFTQDLGQGQNTKNCDNLNCRILRFYVKAEINNKQITKATNEGERLYRSSQNLAPRIVLCLRSLGRAVCTRSGNTELRAAIRDQFRHLVSLVSLMERIKARDTGTPLGLKLSFPPAQRQIHVNRYRRHELENRTCRAITILRLPAETNKKEQNAIYE